MASTRGQRLYVFALLDAPLPGPAPRRPTIEVVKVDALFAAIERRVAPPAADEAALRAQHRIVVRLGRDAEALLPVRFGTLVSRAELERIVRLRRAIFTRALRLVRGKQQMTTRILGTPRATRPPRAPVTGTAYLQARAGYGRPALPAAAKAIRRNVAPVLAAERIDPGRPGIVATMHHLVRRDDVRRYVAMVEAALERLASPPRVVISGPFPPFAFAPDLWSDLDGDRR
jgi:Gas vesicle synthesis protein GvpL/GvpF